MNLLGEGFPDGIIRQIEQRQKVYGSGYSNTTRSSEEIIYLNANTAWCKLISSTNIDKIEAINNPTIKKLGLKGSDLARKFILFNGTVDTTTNEQRGGINYQNDPLGGNNAYGIGGNEFGISPMMGIQTVSVTHINRGSLRQATVKMKAFNKAQMEIIDVLYLRLGYSVLLEWGNSMYFDNKGVLQTNTNNSLAYDFLNGSESYNSFLKKIDKNRAKSVGNYDAMFAKVKNFSWSFLKDGSYDITLDLISSGDIIESLKINAIVEDTLNTDSATKKPEEKPEDDGDLIDWYAKKNSIGQFFYYCKYQLVSGVGVKGTKTDDSITFSFSDIGTNTIKEQNESIKSNNKLIKAGHFTSWAWDAIFDTHYVDEYLAPLISENISPDMFKIYDKEGKIMKVIDAISIPWDDKNGDDETYYVRLGTFLSYIQNYLIPKCVPADASLKDYSPLLNIDYDQNTNLMYAYKWQVGVDPRICIVGRTINIIQGLFWETLEDVPFSGDCSPFIDPDYSDIAPGLEYGNIMNIYVNMAFILNKIDELKDAKNKTSLFDLLKGILDGVNEGLGSLNALEPIIDESTNTIKIIDANPLPNNDEVMSKINGFYPKIVNIPTELASFDLYGYNTSDPASSMSTYNGASHASFIKDFSFATEITPELATMITVGAAANGSVVGSESTALSKLNVGLSDRYKKEILDAYALKQKAKEQQQNIINSAVTQSLELDALKTRYNKTLSDYFDWLEELSDLPSEPTMNVDDVDAYKGTILNIKQMEDQIASKTYTVSLLEKGIDPNDVAQQKSLATGTGFIPFNMSLTMDGLSGMKIYSKFTVDTDFLPSNYPGNVEFLIKGVTHDIADNKWFTKIESFCISKGKFGEVATSTNTSTTQTAVSAPVTPTGTVVTTPVAAQAATPVTQTANSAGMIKTLNSGFELNKYIISGVTDKGQWNINGTPIINKKTQIYIHHTAGWARSDKGKGVINDWNGRALKVMNQKTWTAGSPYVMDKDGWVEQLADDRYFYITQGSQFGVNSNKIGIGIEISNPGQAELKNGDWYALGGNISKNKVYGLTNGVNGVSPLGIGNGISYLVDENGIPTTYRKHQYGVSYFPAQVVALEKLLRKLMTTHGIPFKWEGKSTYEQIFPNYPSSSDPRYKTLNANNSVPGIYTHGVVYPKGKSDFLPTKEMIEMLKRFK